jgi:hypothetical protein
MVVQILVS